MVDTAGYCSSDLQYLRRAYQKRSKQPDFLHCAIQCFNHLDSTEQPNITLNEEFFWLAVYKDDYLMNHQLEHQLNLAVTLIHELAHFCVAEWRPDICRPNEPLINIKVDFPEAGLSWERFVFGGCLYPSYSEGPMRCSEIEHVYPSESPISLPIIAPVPADYAAR